MRVWVEDRKSNIDVLDVTCTQHRHIDVNVDVNIVVVACIYVREWVEGRKSNLSHILNS